MTTATKPPKAPKAPKESKLPVPPKGKVVKMHISSIVNLPDIQPRKNGLDDDNVDRCTDVLMAGEEYKEPPVVYGTKESAVVSEGFHRMAGYDDFWDKKDIPEADRFVTVELRPGGEAEARLFALPSNADHLGLPRSQEDARKAIDRCLKINPDWTDRKVADFVKVRDHEAVGRRRVELEKNEEIVKTTTRQTKSGGTVKVKEKPATPAPSANGTQEEQETIEAPVSFTAKHWRDLPIQGGIEIPGVNEHSVEAWQKKTGSLKVGELFDAIHASEVKGVGEYGIAEILAEIAKLDGFDGVKPTPKNIPEPAKTTKAGDVVYSWSGLEAMFLRWGQFPDEIKRAYPKKEIEGKLEEIRGHLNNALACAKKLQKELAS